MKMTENRLITHEYSVFHVYNTIVATHWQPPANCHYPTTYRAYSHFPSDEKGSMLCADYQ